MPKLPGLSLAIVVPILSGQVASASSPATLRLPGNPTPGAWFSAQFITTETSTTQGRPLRIYDQHIAQMFAVIGGLCRQFPKVQGWRWDYRAGNGAIPMGEFRIPCDMAATMLDLFGKGREQTIPVTIGVQAQNLRVTSLNLAGEQIPRWLEVTANFRPWVNAAGQVRQIRGTLHRTQIPVLLPHQPLQAGGMQLFFTTETSDPNRYAIGLYTFPGCTAGACSFGSLSGHRGGNYLHPAKPLPGMPTSGSRWRGGCGVSS